MSVVLATILCLSIAILSWKFLRASEKPRSDSLSGCLQFVAMTGIVILLFFLFLLTQHTISELLS